jgi:hypothetical protein
MRMSNDSKSMKQLDGSGDPYKTQSAIPRKLSPIQRDSAASADRTGLQSCPHAAATVGEHADRCPNHPSNKIPLPQLDRPIYEEETADGFVTLSAL